MEKIEVKTMSEALKKATEMIGEIEMNKEASERAGYDVYCSKDGKAWASGLGDRLEVNAADGTTTNVWVSPDSRGTEEYQVMMLHTWLCKYTDEVIHKALAKVNEILADNTTMKLLHRLRLEECHNAQSRANALKLCLHSTHAYDFSIQPIVDNAQKIRDVLYMLWLEN